MKTRITSFILFLLIALPAFSRIPAEKREALKADINARLVKTSTAADSLPLLYDLYDLSSIQDQKKIGWTILNTARRAGDSNAVMDMCRQLASFNIKSDSTLRYLASVNSMLPENEVQQATDLFIAVKLATHNVMYLPEAERQKELTRILARRNGEKDNTYEDIKELYTLALYLGGNSKGGMYKDYVNRLDKEIGKLPERALSIRNLFYTSSAIFYSKNMEYEKSIAADKKLLESISQLEERYKKNGRKYRNFDLTRYSAYRRIMGNYEVLPISTVDSLYNLAMQLAKTNSDVAAENAANPRIRISYLMAHKQYAQAIPLIKEFLGKEIDDNNNGYRIKMLRMLKEAAIATGDNATLLEALKEYNDQLEEYFKLNAEGTYRELQVRYDVNELRQKNHQLDIQKRDLVLKTDRQIIIISVIAACILLFIIIMLHRRHTNMKMRLRELEEQLNRLKVADKSLADLNRKK